VAREATVPPEIKARVVASADGVPLFVEELTKAFLEAGAPAERRDGGILVEGTATLAIPLTLEGSLVARLDRQAAAAKEVAQLGACVGREFSFGLLAATKLLASGRMIEEAFERLVASGLVLRRGEGAETIYGFKHALVRDAAYGTLPKSKRRALHARIARTLEEVSPETVRAEPELLAFHYTEAAMTHEAVGHWRKAGEAALARSAHAEAVARLGKALTLLAGLPEDDDRRRRELKLQLALGRALIAARGEAASETGQAYARARQLCEEVGDSPHALPVLYGRYIYRFGRGELRRARELAKEYLDRAKHVGNVPAQATGHRMLGITSLHLGRLHKARAHLERALATSSAAPTRSPDVFYPYDPRVVCLARLSDALLLLGYPDQALARCRAALAEAQALAHPETLGIALASSIGLHQDLRDAETVEEQAQALVALGAERGIAYFRQEGMLALGWVLAERAKPDEGLETMRPVLAAFRADEKALGMTYRLLTVAGVCGKARRAAEGLDLLADAFDLAQRTGEHWFEAEQHRVKGELLLSAPAPDEAAAEVCFREALAVASRQGARMWELRAATSLARLRRTQGRHAEALDLLAPAHAWFTEGFEARDLVEAGALLESSRCSLAGCDPGGRS
jgi:predicted ATPase